jgi:carboxypeptidase C (cathepsin A)
MGFFAENLGPQVINGDGSVVENPHRLSKKYNLMAVDNPVGSGFSYTKNGAYVKSEEEMRAQFVQGLRNFFVLHPDLLKHPLWVTGESYAGKYIPNIVHELDAQIKLDRESKGQFANLTLKGMIIGNGLYNATASYPSVGDLAYGAGVIDDKILASLNQNVSKCLQKIQEQSKTAGDYCENVTVRWIYNDVVHMPMYYDLGLTDSDLDSISSSMGSWLNRDDVKAALHVSGHTWVNNDEVGPVAEALMSDFVISSAPLVAEAAENGYRVALYNGVRDGFVCNHLGNHQALLAMDQTWKFKGQYASAEQTPFWFQLGSTKARVAGFHKIVENFSFTKLLNTGHLVPTVVPEEFAAFIYWVTHPSSVKSTSKQLVV